MRDMPAAPRPATAGHSRRPWIWAGLSIADGAWIITMGIYGWLGYIGEFGLTALPLLALGREAVAKYAAAA